VWKGRTKALIGYLHEKLKRVNTPGRESGRFVTVLFISATLYFFLISMCVFLLQSLQSVEYYHMKMMIVGLGGRGKSSLLKALMKHKPTDQECLPTVGIVVKDWK